MNSKANSDEPYRASHGSVADIASVDHPRPRLHRQRIEGPAEISLSITDQAVVLTVSPVLSRTEVGLP
jgi:hypothetical protein